MQRELIPRIRERAYQLRARPAALNVALELTHWIFDDFEFRGTATDISTPIGEALRDRRGGCQDFAQLIIHCLRSIGLPARYMSGILKHPLAGGAPDRRRRVARHTKLDAAGDVVLQTSDEAG